MASLLKKCDVHVFANTYDDPDAAALAELAAIRFTFIRSASWSCRTCIRLMLISLMRLSPFHFAASQTETDKPIATIYPASIGTPLPRALRRKGVFVVAHAGRLAPERSPVYSFESRRLYEGGVLASPRGDGVHARHTPQHAGPAR